MPENKNKKLCILLALLLVITAAAGVGVAWKLNSKINQLSLQTTQLENQLKDSGQISGWAGLKWCSYGDSITQEATWQDYVTEYFGFAEHYQRGIGGSRFVNNGQTWYANEDGTFNSMRGFNNVWDAPEGTTEHEGWMCSWDRITTMIPQDTDLVVIMAGTNDADQETGSPMGDLSYPFDESTFMGAVASTVVKIQEWVPDAIIVLASPLSGRGISEEWMQTDSDMNQNQTEVAYNSLGYTTQDYAAAIEEVAEYLSIPFIDVFGNTGINQFNRQQYIRDLVHPTQEGGKAIARVMIGGLEAIAPVGD